MKYAITIIFGLLVAIGLMFLTPRLAHAQSQGTQCGQHDKITGVLQDKYSETRRAIATSKENFVEVFASKAGTWTLLISIPSGLTCIFATGDDWESLPVEIEGKNS